MEIGEQLAWVASALYFSPSQKELVLVEAHIETIKSVEGREESNADYICNISFIESRNTTAETENGQCWHPLFQSQAVVKGYPIPRRSAHHTGLEISISAMAALVGTNRINLFNDKIYIKGFSAMVVPTEHSDDIVLWHLLYNKTGNQISYFDSKIAHAKDINLSSINNRRHILGWSSTVRCLSGKNLTPCLSR